MLHLFQMTTRLPQGYPDPNVAQSLQLILEQFSTVHFQFIDKTGSALVLEFDPATGVNLLYDNPSGVLTNDPQLPIQRRLFQDLLSLPQQVSCRCLSRSVVGASAGQS